MPAELIDGANSVATNASESELTSSFPIVSNSSSYLRYPFALEGDKAIPLDGYARLADIEINGQSWTTHGSLENRNGQIVFTSKSW
jgi:hypothetical protein